jgi:hypothetical protein
VTLGVLKNKQPTHSLRKFVGLCICESPSINVVNVQGTDNIYLLKKISTSVLAHSRRGLGDDYGYV